MTLKPNTINGLILSGGTSSRMGKDKAMLTYHQESQLNHLHQLLSSYCDKVFVSAKKTTDYIGFDIIEDQFEFTSPLNGIASAIQTHPNASWLVVACDMPNIEQASIDQLINSQNESHDVVCFENEEGIIEPLLSFWEAGQFDQIESYINSGKRSVKGYIETHKNLTLAPDSYDWLVNINTPSERDSFSK